MIKYVEEISTLDNFHLLVMSYEPPEPQSSGPYALSITLNPRPKSALLKRSLIPQPQNNDEIYNCVLRVPALDFPVSLGLDALQPFKSRRQGPQTLTNCHKLCGLAACQVFGKPGGKCFCLRARNLLEVLSK